MGSLKFAMGLSLLSCESRRPKSIIFVVALRKTGGKGEDEK